MGIVVAATLTACSGGDGKQSGSTSADAEEMGPLDEYMTAMWSGEEWTQETYDAQALVREDLIAQCMAKEGFDYTPNPDNGTTVLSSDDDSGIAWGSLEYAQTYGYGAIDWPGRAEQDAAFEEEELPVDPNWDYVQSLSDSEQEAYYATLYGQPVYNDLDEGEDGEVYEYNWEDNGCWGWAEHEQQMADGDPSAAWADAEFEDLFNSMESVWSDSQTDPEMVALDAEWSSCMADAGHPGFASTNEAMNSIYDRQNEIWESASDPETGEWIDEPTQADFDAIQADEIALATADWKCKDKVDYDARSRKVQFRIQQEFVDANKDRLDALVAKYASSEG